MTTDAPRKLTDVLTREERRVLSETSDLAGWRGVIVTWSIIAACFALVAWRPGVVTVLVALVLLGGRQLALQILMHEASHRSLFRTRWLNDTVGEWLCAAPAWGHLEAYRRHHLRHHAKTNQPEDPDLGLSEGFPVSRRSMARKVLRDLGGITGLKRIYAQVLMDAGVWEYTASTKITPIDQTGRHPGHVVRTFLFNFGPVLITNLALFGVLRWFGHPLLYLLWIGAYLTTFSLIIRIRSMAEHGRTPHTKDPFENTRTTRAGLLARVTVAPHGVNHHLEHHLMPGVPYHQLPRMHRILRERGVFDEHNYAPSYLAVMRRMVE